MGSVIHFVEVAVLLAVAYTVGWLAGYLAHRLALGRAAPAAVVPPERLAAVTAPPSSDALVKAPVVAPLAAAPAPVAAPAQAAAESVAATPAPIAIETLKTLSQTMPLRPAPLPEAPTPAVEPLPPAEPPAMPSSQPGMAWSGSLHGHEAVPFERETDQAVPAEPVPETPAIAPDAVAAAPTVVPAAAEDASASEQGTGRSDAAEAVTPQAVPVADGTEERPLEDMTAAVLNPSVAAAPGPAEPSPGLETVVAEDAADGSIRPVLDVPPAAQIDEDAAMRAIEGGWSRRDARALPDAPELTDVTAAVSAAQSAVEQALARSGIDPATASPREQSAFGKPVGLPHPRHGHRDNLKQINGLGPLDESTLNNLGIYHFDQIIAWDQKEVLWMENHAFARGRIGREDWQGQARALIEGEKKREA